MKKEIEYISSEILNSPLYDPDLMDQIYKGIIINIKIEMDKQNISTSVLAKISGVSYSHLTRILKGDINIGIDVLIRTAYALKVSPTDLFPFDINKRKTNGERFDELTKGMDMKSCNFLLGMCADYVKEWRRLKREL